MASAAPVDPGWSAEVFGFRDRDLSDPAHDLQTAAAPDPRVDAQYCAVDGSRDSGARFLDAVTPCSGLGAARKAAD
jgi:hypothetical protein